MYHSIPPQESFFWRNHSGAYVMAGHYGSNKAARRAAKELSGALGMHVGVVWLYGRKLWRLPLVKGGPVFS